MPKKGRRRPRKEIGLGSEAIARSDREEEFNAHYEAARASEAARQKPSYVSDFPSLDELKRNWKTTDHPDEWGNSLVTRDECGTWKLVIPVENMHPTFVGNAKRLQQERGSVTFDQFKQYMKSKYAVTDEILDCFVDDKK